MTHFIWFNRIFSIFPLLFCSLFSTMSFASVDIRMGSFSYVTTDIDGMERTYSDIFTSKGLFGEKWKTVYDNRLQIDKKENILTVFDAVADKYYKFIINRDGAWQGTSGTMSTISNNYTWEFKDSQYIFNGQGLLIEYHINEYEFYALKYNKDGHIRYFVTYDNDEYDVNTNSEGNIVSFTRMNADSIDLIEYDYQDGLLVNVIEKNNDENPVTTEYKYNYDGYLKFINDGSNYISEISYETYDGKVRVNKYKDYSSITYYEYKLISDDLREKHYSVITYKKHSSNEHKKTFEYIDVYQDGMFAYTKNFKKYINNKLVYDGKYINKCKPSSIVKNGYETTYAYNAIGKITYVHRVLKDSSEAEFWAHYSYNIKNNLTSASNSDGLTINLQYDDNENIIVMSTKDKTIYISYNHFKKPITITINGVGTVNVTYDEHGDISSVDSGDAGHKLALEITQAFQVMLTIISAATKNSI